MIMKKRKYIAVTDDQFVFTDDDPVTTVDDTADVVVESGLANVRLTGSTDDVGDIFIISDSTGVSAYGLDGYDIFIFSNTSGTIRAGTGADIVIADGFSGTIDFGADDDGDLVILSNSPGVTLVNYDPERDTLITDQIA